MLQVKSFINPSSYHILFKFFFSFYICVVGVSLIPLQCLGIQWNTFPYKCLYSGEATGFATAIITRYYYS